jgi:cell fate regulator YaaT (PSP1 superfamily)
MAKAQNLSLNPSKISGLCGRLLCCLGYENEYYLEASKLMPKINSLVMTPSGRGVVVYNDLLKMTSQVRIESENTSDIKTFELSEIKILDKGNQ